MMATTTCVSVILCLPESTALSVLMDTTETEMASVRKLADALSMEVKKIAIAMECAFKKDQVPSACVIQVSLTMVSTNALVVRTLLWSTLMSATNQESGSLSKKTRLVRS